MVKSLYECKGCGKQFPLGNHKKCSCGKKINKKEFFK